MKIDVAARILGSMMVIVGYVVALNLNITAGAVMMSTGDILAVPFFIKTKAWDAVIMISFLSVVTIHKLIQVM